MKYSVWQIFSIGRPQHPRQPNIHTRTERWPRDKIGVSGIPCITWKMTCGKIVKTICLFLSLPIGKFCPDFLSLRNYLCINTRMTDTHLSRLTGTVPWLTTIREKPRDLITKRCKDRWIWFWGIRNYLPNRIIWTWKRDFLISVEKNQLLRPKEVELLPIWSRHWMLRLLLKV